MQGGSQSAVQRFRRNVNSRAQNIAPVASGQTTFVQDVGIDSGKTGCGNRMSGFVQRDFRQRFPGDQTRPRAQK